MTLPRWIRRTTAGLMMMTMMALPGPVFAEQENPLLKPWQGPNGGLPPFDQIRSEQFGPALTEAIETLRQEIAAIADSSAAPTFANTIEAYEDTGRDYTRVMAIFRTYTATLNDQTMQALEREWSPRFAALADEIIQNERLFKRIAAVYNSPEYQKLNEEQQRLTWVHYNRFVKRGAQLDTEQKSRLSAINERLATLYTQFGQNMQTDEETDWIVLESRKDLEGLSQATVDGAAADAVSLGLDGKWVVRNTRSSAEPFLTESARRDLREKVFAMWVSRGDKGGETDNNGIASEILQLRAERAELLGYETHAHWQLADSMAKDPKAAMKLMLEVWKPAVERVEEEVADMEEVAREMGHEITIEPWDYRYYAERVRKKKYDLDAEAIRPYLQLDKITEAQFWVANQLFGLEFEQLDGIPVYHPDVQVFEVTGQDGEHVGYFYFDPYAREGKRSGAWMSQYRPQERFKQTVTPIVSNNSNYVKGRPGEPVLLSWDDAKTNFHEFGHALHGLLSDVDYPSLAGTSVARDFVEFPSQVYEHWLSTPEVLNRFALHVETGEPMPAELIERIERAATFNKGFTTVEFLASGLVDMKLHLAGDTEIDTRAFEKETLTELGMPSSIVMRHRIPHFAHVFSGDGYSAGYYSYLWAEVLDQDTWQAFMDGDGPFDQELAEGYHKWVLSAGNKREPAEAYREFRGQDPSIAPLLRSRGFPVPEELK